MIGSSTAFGEGASSTENSWVGLMRTYLNTMSGGPVHVINSAVSGSKSADLMTNVTWGNNNITAALKLNPDLVIVGIGGGNDIQNDVTESQFMANLNNIKNAYNTRKIPIFFTGTSPKNSLDSTGRAMLSAWDGVMRQAFTSCSTPQTSWYSSCFIDLYAGLANADGTIKSAYASSDGTHLDDSGHAFYESVALPIVKNYVCSIVSCH